MSHDEDDEKSQEDKEYEYELMMETAAILEDLSMRLVHYDDEMAKQALALALGSLAAHYEEPCLHQLMELATAHMEAIQKQIENEKSKSN
jgi:hypothetical protein